MNELLLTIWLASVASKNHRMHTGQGVVFNVHRVQKIIFIGAFQEIMSSGSTIRLYQTRVKSIIDYIKWCLDPPEVSKHVNLAAQSNSTREVPFTYCVTLALKRARLAILRPYVLSIKLLL